ncbi:MAG: copper chaperone PCu(A)C [Holosporales bacterium]
MKVIGLKSLGLGKAALFLSFLLLGGEGVFCSDPLSLKPVVPISENSHPRKPEVLILKPSCRVLKGCKNGAIYMTISLSSPDVLLQASLPSDIADRVELHTHQEKKGILKMMALENLPIPSGVLQLKSGKDHLMVIGLKKDLVPGEKIPLTLTFAKAGVFKLDVLVEGTDWRKSPVREEKKICPSCCNQ